MLFYKKIYHSLGIITLSLLTMNAWSQSSSLIADGAHDFIRRAQLCGAIHENNSLMVTDFSANLNWLDSLMRNGTVSKKRKNIQRAK